MDLQKDFQEIIQLITNARGNALRAINTELIRLYWSVGKYLSVRVKENGWGKSTVLELAHFIEKHSPETKGFSDKNLWRMKQFYETYSDDEKLATLWRVLTWSHNKLIFPLKKVEERAFYLQLAVEQKLSVRELHRQINTSYFERTMLGSYELQKREIKTTAPDFYKEAYIFEFLDLPEKHTESQLKGQLLSRLKRFLLELGKDFLFVGEEYRLQVGNHDYRIDLLFYHRELQCLVAFELKTVEFEPEHLGKLNFYLEALDRDVKKPHENPSIGILLCKNKDNEVVEYALNRQLSPTLVSQYYTALPDKKLLQAKLHEIWEIWTQQNEELT